METEYKTLRELNVRPGDVVEWNGHTYTAFEMPAPPSSNHCWARRDDCGWISEYAEVRLISRAPRNDTAGDKPVLWRDMTDAEKGALLLASFRGKVIEGTRLDVPEDWRVTVIGLDNIAYRVKPEPKVETVTLYGHVGVNTYFNLDRSIRDTHRITFNRRDGKTDVDSAKMEEL